MKRMILSISAVVMMVSFCGCNMIAGIGKDLSTVGGWITNGSEHVEESIKNNPPGSKMNQE